MMAVSNTSPLILLDKEQCKRGVKKMTKKEFVKL